MKKLYKKFGWIFNGLMIGFMIAGLVGRSYTVLIAGAMIGLLMALVFKATTWLKKRAEYAELERVESEN